MQLYLENETEITFDFDIENIAKAVIEKVLEVEKCPYEIEVNLLLTDNEGIQEYNRQMRDIDRPTDVLSFPGLFFDEPSVFDIASGEEADYTNPETGNIILGDIIISVEKILEQAEEYGHSIMREYAFLIAHSMFHLCGYDHMTEDEAKVMEEKQENILTMLKITRDAFGKV